MSLSTGNLGKQETSISGMLLVNYMLFQKIWQLTYL
uniref:Uncharacterized protein n=1 Tax=Arundo donax TaxID=35708 RepID=A0A0A9DFD6_ARUDO